MVTTDRTSDTRRLERFGRPFSPAELQVICIPHAGAGAAAFAPLAAAATATGIAIAAFRPPGRENLLAEPALEDAASVIRSAVDLVSAENPRDYAILGQCSGAYLALEVARALSDALGRSPRCVFAASQGPPSWDMPERDYLREDLDAQVQRVLQYVDINPVLAASEDFMAMYRATLAADIAVTRSYFSNGPYPPLGARLVALCGSEEDDELIASQEGWRHFTEGCFAVRVIAGPHLITSADPELVLRTITQEV